MKNVAIVLAVFFLAGCAGVEITEKNTTIVMAKKVVKEGGAHASDITDTFGQEGQIFAFLTFRWEPISTHAGAQRIEVRWFNGDQEIQRRTHDANFGSSPWHAWFATTGLAIGPGKCRVDAYVNGKLAATRSFAVVEK